MSDRPTGAAPAAPAATPAREHSEAEVANVLAPFLGVEDDPKPARGDRGERAERDRAAAAAKAGDEPTEDEESPPAEGEEDDAAADDESPPSGDDEADEETPEDKALPPPVGWNAEDKKGWSQLPPAVQETIRRRDSEMTARLTRGTQEQAERERAWTQQLEGANADRDQYHQNLEVFRDVLLPDARALDNVDWQRLSNENPAEYIRLTAARDAMRDRLGWIQNEVTRIQQQRLQETARRQAEARQFGHARLVEAMPEFADATKAQKLGSELGSYLRKYGFTDSEISSVVDHRAIVLAMTAMQAEKAETARNGANGKRTPTPAPQVQRAGSSRRGEGDSQRNRMTQLTSRFEKSRSVKDAASILAEWMS